MEKDIRIIVTEPSEGYELLDSGDGEKLERFGSVLMARPDPQALWPKRLPEAAWKKAAAYFTRDSERAEWSFRGAVPPSWPIPFGGLTMQIKPTAFKHTGLFPEQSANWEWMRRLIESVAGDPSVASSRGPARVAPLRSAPPRSRPALGGAEGSDADGAPEILNLFGYTGGASLACAQAGAKVVHIDSSRAAVTWARENAELSGLADKPIRWIVEDARRFVEREIKRGRSYDGIIMDPPAFGHGADDEIWKIEDHFVPLVADCMRLLKPAPLFFLVNGYSAGYSALAYRNVLQPLVARYGGEIEIGELAIREASGPTIAGAPHGQKMPVRLLPAGISARWSRG